MGHPEVCPKADLNQTLSVSVDGIMKYNDCQL